MGGHFQTAAAEFAIDNVEPHAVGAIEIYRTGKGANVRMKFSYELVAVAMVKMRDANTHTVEEFLKEAFTFLKDAVRHAGNAAQIVTRSAVRIDSSSGPHPARDAARCGGVLRG